MRVLALLLAVAAPVLADRVVLRDRTILEGSVRASPDGKFLDLDGKKVRADTVLLWEDGAGAAKNAPDLRDHVRGLAFIADRELLVSTVDLLPQAIAAGDVEAARTLLARAERAGLETKQAEGWQAKIDRLEGSPVQPFAVPPEEALAKVLVDRARVQMAADEHRGLELLRVALQVSPSNEAANGYLVELAPDYWFGSRDKDAFKRNWLDWSIEVLAGGVRVLKRRHPDMERATRFWDRTDLRGLETSEIIFITSMEDPTPVTMCLRLARLTCQALDRMFAVERPAREDFLPLIVYFYENQEEYVAKSRAGIGGGPAKELGLTAGHYIPSENISRFFWPRHPGAERSVRETFVHELTHHWIERRNPRWHARDLATDNARVAVPGFWVVEGMAVFMQEGRYDEEHGVWSHFDPHSQVLDVVAALSESGGLIPWEEFFKLSQVDFQTKLMTSATQIHATAKCRWRVTPIPLSKVVVFYQQAGAACQFLYWGEDGKYRQPLYDYVTSFYTSKADRTGIEDAFGLTAEELGRKIEAHAKKVIGGWRPKGEDG